MRRVPLLLLALLLAMPAAAQFDGIPLSPPTGSGGFGGSSPAGVLPSPEQGQRSPGPAAAQGGLPRPSEAPVTFTADEVEYDQENGIVTARGKVEAWQEGRLLRADGRPAAFVSVHLEESSHNRLPHWMAMGYATTDRDGNYRFPRLHHIDALLRAHCESTLGEWVGEPFDLSKPGTVVKLPDAKLGEPATIEGVLRDAQQQPVGGVRVWLRDWDMARQTQRSGSLVETLTDAQGRYRFLGVPLGGAWLELLTDPSERHASTKAVEPFEVEAGKTYAFDLQLPAAK